MCDAMKHHEQNTTAATSAEDLAIFCCQHLLRQQLWHQEQMTPDDQQTVRLQSEA